MPVPEAGSSFIGADNRLGDIEHISPEELERLEETTRRYLKKSKLQGMSEEDVLHNILLEIIPKADEFKGQPLSYLEGTIWNRCVDVMRKTTTRKVRKQTATGEHPDLTTVPDRRPGPPDMLVAKELREFLDDLLSTLRRDERKILELRFTQNLTNREIAAKIGSTEAAVTKRLQRLLGNLRERYDE